MTPHVFYATRKGTPKGVAGDWARRCDVCGEGPDTPAHRAATQEQHDAAVLKAIAAD